MPRPTIILLASTLFFAAPFAVAQDARPKTVPTRGLQATPVQTKGKAPKVFQVDKPIDIKLTLPDIAGKQHSFEKYLGKTVIVDFWSVRCPVSVRYEERMKALHARYKDDPSVVFLAINANHTELAPGDDPYVRIRKYVKDAEIPYPILIDRNNVVADRFGAKTTPHMFVIDPKGILRYAGGVDDDPAGKKKPGDVKSWAADAVALVKAGKPVAVKNTKPEGCAIKRVKKKKVDIGS